MKNKNNIEDLILSSMGWNGIKNKIISESIQYASKKVKSHFGIEMKFDSAIDVNKVTEFISTLDNNFNSHISNSYEVKSTKPIIDSTFIINLEKATYMLVSGEYNYDTSNDRVLNSLYIYIFGKSCYKWVKKLSRYMENTNNSMIAYSISGSKSSRDADYWTCIGRDILPRDFDTLYFDNNIDTQIKDHLDKWINNEDVYKQRGLIFKTGILIHGTAGTGKSSIATAIATYLKCNLISIDTSTFSNINLVEVVDTINSDSDRYVILLDEIDAIFKSRDDDNISESQTDKVIKLLTFLDSVNSPDNVVFVATTNYFDRLDEALIRKGRFDKVIEIGNISKSTAHKMCKGFGLREDKIKEILSNKDNSINPSNLQAEILEKIKVD